MLTAEGSQGQACIIAKLAVITNDATSQDRPGIPRGSFCIKGWPIQLALVIEIHFSISPPISPS